MNDDIECVLLAEIIRDPKNIELRSVYADLLLERGDPRGEWLVGTKPLPREVPIEWVANVCTFKPGEEIVNEKDGSIFVWVPPDIYPIGDDLYDDERPIHNVELTGFWIGKYPITNEQYAKFIEETGYQIPKYWNDDRFNQPRQPIVGVSWCDAQAYCQWAGLRLPTEAE